MLPLCRSLISFSFHGDCWRPNGAAGNRTQRQSGRPDGPYFPHIPYMGKTKASEPCQTTCPIRGRVHLAHQPGLQPPYQSTSFVIRLVSRGVVVLYPAHIRCGPGRACLASSQISSPHEFTLYQRHDRATSDGRPSASRTVDYTPKGSPERLCRLLPTTMILTQSAPSGLRCSARPLRSSPEAW
jgi:hypothetical protein